MVGSEQVQVRWGTVTSLQAVLLLDYRCYCARLQPRAEPGPPGCATERHGRGAGGAGWAGLGRPLLQGGERPARPPAPRRPRPPHPRLLDPGHPGRGHHRPRRPRSSVGRLPGSEFTNVKNVSTRQQQQQYVTSKIVEGTRGPFYTIGRFSFLAADTLRRT